MATPLVQLGRYDSTCGEQKKSGSVIKLQNRPTNAEEGLIKTIIAVVTSDIRINCEQLRRRRLPVGRVAQA